MGSSQAPSVRALGCPRDTNALITREHNGHSFTFREDGWFNMTKAAKAFGKDIKNFFDNKSTTEYMDALLR